MRLVGHRTARRTCFAVISSRPATRLGNLARFATIPGICNVPLPRQKRGGHRRLSVSFGLSGYRFSYQTPHAELSTSRHGALTRVSAINSSDASRSRPAVGGPQPLAGTRAGRQLSSPASPAESVAPDGGASGSAREELQEAVRALHRISRLVSVCYEPDILRPVCDALQVTPLRMSVNRFTRIVACDDPATRTRVIALRGVAWRGLPKEASAAQAAGGLASLLSEMSPDSPWLGMMLGQFWPVAFEDAALGVRVHRGAYTLGEELYEALAPEIGSLPAGWSLRLAGHSLGGSLALLVAMMLRARDPAAVPPARLFVDAFGSFAPALHTAGPGISYLEPFNIPQSHVRWTVLGSDIVPRSYTTNDFGFAASRQISIVQSALELRDRARSIAGGIISPERFLFDTPGLLFHLRPIHSALAGGSPAPAAAERPGPARERGGGALSRRVYDVTVARGRGATNDLLRVDPALLARDPMAPLRDHLHRQYEGALASAAAGLPRTRIFEDPRP